MKVILLIGKFLVGIAVIAVIALVWLIVYAGKRIKDVLSRPTTCPKCIVGVLYKNEYSDKVCTIECNNTSCDYVEKC